ncbi:hypothetical protein Q3258_16855 [Clostridioides difficile]
MTKVRITVGCVGVIDFSQPNKWTSFIPRKEYTMNEERARQFIESGLAVAVKEPIVKTTKAKEDLVEKGEEKPKAKRGRKPKTEK